MSKKLSAEHRHLMRLILKDQRPDGWTPVSSTVWPFAKMIPKELVWCHDTEKLIRLSDAGKVVLEWT